MALSSYWLITERGGGHMRVFTTRLHGGEQALPIFGHSEEASDFLTFAGLEDGWEIRETGTRELVSILSSRCNGVQSVLLDPFPGIEVSLLRSLIDISRRRFVEFLLSTAEVGQAILSNSGGGRRAGAERSKPAR